MAFTPTEEQNAIIKADLIPQCVIACAGSGKTASAVRRMLEIRQRIGRARGYVALFSYSNIAVHTFRKEYAALSNQVPDLSPRVFIGTMDAFIATQIILPHSGRVMGCTRQPFLVVGGEPFLNGYTVYNGSYPTGIEDMRVKVDSAGNMQYRLQSFNGLATTLDPEIAEQAIRKLGQTGAYTYDLGRYWALLTLRAHPRLLTILAERYPYVLVDEAQDIGSMHGELLRLLQDAGSCISLIGDPNQAIFEFADADGSFLRGLNSSSGTLSQPLTENRRSVGPIVAVANALSSTNSKAIRENPVRKHGAYLLTYGKDDLEEVVDTFASIVRDYDYANSEAMVLCRGSAMVDRLSGGADERGQGATAKLACAAIWRDRQGDMADAFEFILDGALKLLQSPPQSLRRDVLGGSSDATAKSLRRALWRFLRDPNAGLPPANLPGKSKWQPTLKSRISELLSTIEHTCGLKRSDSWRNKLTAARLGDGPLLQSDRVGKNVSGISIRTVHQAKGEGIGAVLYVAKQGDIKSLLAGPSSEEGRIGYVAVTRARDLLLLAIPTTTKADAINKLQRAGFKRWP